ncbi:MAG: hypothetical protein WA210_18365 [Burkholderiaceae bacterium]
MERRLASALVTLWVCSACGGSSGGAATGAAPGVPAPAAALDARVKSDMVRAAPLVANVHSSLLGILNPGSVAAQGVTLVADSTPGAAPNTFNFSGPYDGNGDGYNESTLSGRVSFAGDPATTWSSLEGNATIDIGIPLIGHVYSATVAFSVTSSEIRVSGYGALTNPLNGSTSSVEYSSSEPMVINQPGVAVGATANACGYSLHGTAVVRTADSTGTLVSSWLFDRASPIATVRNAVYTAPGGQATALPDSSADLRCGGSGSANDWIAVYDQEWVCLPRESGKARLTITATGASTLSIVDEDPPGSGASNTFTATIVGSSAHAMQGFFEAGPPGFRYREDFTWTLLKDGSFSQYSVFNFFEGPNTGKGGICSATARRSP